MIRMTGKTSPLFLKKGIERTDEQLGLARVPENLLESEINHRVDVEWLLYRHISSIFKG